MKALKVTTKENGVVNIPERQRHGVDRRRRLLQRTMADLSDERGELEALSGERTLTQPEEARFDAILAAVAALRPELAWEEEQHALEMEEAERTVAQSRRARGEVEAGILGITPDGRTVRMLRPSERIADGGQAGPSPAELGRIVRAMVVGDSNGAAELLAAHGGSSLSGGGVTLYAGRLIDLARNKTRVIQAGALTVPMEQRELTIAKVASDPSAGWRPENAKIPISELTFAGLTLKARTLGVISRSSVELIEDSANFGNLVEDVLSEVIALEIDRAALLGLGSAQEPLGLQNTEGVQTITGVGTPANHDDFSMAVQKVAEANGMATAAIMTPRDAGVIDRLKDSTNQPLQPPESYRSLNKLSTNQIPTNLGGGSDESLAFVGDFSNVVIGVRTAVRIETTRTASDSTGESAFERLQVWIRAYTRADVAVLRPNHLVMLSGITAA